MVDGYIQEYFQIRSGDTVGLNVDSGWAAGENTNATIGTGILFRIRFKVRRIGVGTADQFKPQVKFNALAWSDAAIMGDATLVPCVLVKESSQYNDGDATTELLTSTSTWEAGEGVEGVRSTGNILTKSIDLDDEETEFEYTFQILGHFVDPSFDETEASDTIEFRLVESDGTVFPNTYTNPVITIAETSGYVGITACENSNRLTYFEDDNDDIYIIGEEVDDTLTSPNPVVIKSADDGATWQIQDRSNNPGPGFDFEAGDLQVVADIGYFCAIDNDDPVHWQFNFSGAASNPDTWQVTSEVIKASVVRDDQSAAFVRRSDNTMIAFFQELVSTFQRITYRIKDPTWGSDNNLDSEASTHFSHASVILGASYTHIFYVDNTNGYLYHQTIDHSTDALGTREQVHNDIGTATNDTFNCIQPILYDPAGGVAERIVVAFKDSSDNLIYTSKVDDNGSPSTPVAATDNTVAEDTIGQNKPVGYLAVDGTDLYLVYADSTNQEIWLTQSDDYGSWDTDVKIVSNVICDWLECFVYSPSGGGKYLGIFYDNDSDGFQGQMWFTAYELESPMNISIDASQNLIRGVKIVKP
jgi:hypothetical protein